MTIEETIFSLRKEINESTCLVAVSKTKSNEEIMEAYKSGQRDFGENKVQEITRKHGELPADIKWHFIGHLQTNKVKFIAPFVHLIHSVDSEKLLLEINKRAENAGRKINCLLQLSIADEESKFGFSDRELLQLVNGDISVKFPSVRQRI